MLCFISFKGNLVLGLGKFVPLLNLKKVTKSVLCFPSSSVLCVVLYFVLCCVSSEQCVARIESHQR